MNGHYSKMEMIEEREVNLTTNQYKLSYQKKKKRKNKWIEPQYSIGDNSENRTEQNFKEMITENFPY